MSIVKSVGCNYKEQGTKPITNRRATSDIVSEFKSFDYIVYEIRNLEEARNFLSSVEEQSILTNHASSVKYYGMLAIDYMFKTLSKEFPKKVLDLTVNVGEDHADLF
ncbi:MAG: palindromic element RPE2 domain-containing protein, partial [Rickettsia endosymbiont of Eriopis connexa]|nr:palindromic element RPE2 domain-containing protein [Rickettsia endosymbiont of Eriopis connexa]